MEDKKRFIPFYIMYTIGFLVIFPFALIVFTYEKIFKKPKLYYPPIKIDPENINNASLEVDDE